MQCNFLCIDSVPFYFYSEQYIEKLKANVRYYWFLINNLKTKLIQVKCVYIKMYDPYVVFNIFF